MGIKMPMPDKYDRNPSPDVLEEWIVSMIRYFHLYGLIKKSNDLIMVNLIGMCLGDTAAEWFHSTVEQDTEAWLPPEVLDGIQDRFIHELELHKAANRFNALSQGNMDTKQLYQELVKLAQQRVESSLSYDLMRRYYEAMQPSIHTKLANQGYMPESPLCTLELLRKQAAVAQNALRYARATDQVEEQSNTKGCSTREADRSSQ
jgi:hypothetical protein